MPEGQMENQSGPAPESTKKLGFIDSILRNVFKGEPDPKKPNLGLSQDRPGDHMDQASGRPSESIAPAGVVAPTPAVEQQVTEPAPAPVAPVAEEAFSPTQSTLAALGATPTTPTVNEPIPMQQPQPEAPESQRAA